MANRYAADNQVTTSYLEASAHGVVPSEDHPCSSQTLTAGYQSHGNVDFENGGYPHISKPDPVILTPWITSNNMSGQGQKVLATADDVVARFSGLHP